MGRKNRKGQAAGTETENLPVGDNGVLEGTVEATEPVQAVEQPVETATELESVQQETPVAVLEPETPAPQEENAPVPESTPTAEAPAAEIVASEIVTEAPAATDAPATAEAPVKPAKKERQPWTDDAVTNARISFLSKLGKRKVWMSGKWTVDEDNLLNAIDEKNGVTLSIVPIIRPGKYGEFDGEKHGNPANKKFHGAERPKADETGVWAEVHISGTWADSKFAHACVRHNSMDGVAAEFRKFFRDSDPGEALTKFKEALSIEIEKKLGAAIPEWKNMDGDVTEFIRAL